MLSLIPLPYRLLAIALLIVATFAAGWVKGNDHGTAKLTEFVAKQAAESTRIAQARTIITEKISDEHAKQDAAIAARYAAAKRLLDAGSGAKPVPISSNVCETAAANNGLSDAVSGYLERQRQIIAAERAAVAGLLETAERNTKALTDTQVWLTQQQAVH